MKEIIMPKLGETMEEGYLTRWFCQEGDRVAKGDPLFEIMSDKTNFEVESPADGFLRRIVVPAGERPVPVITTVGWVAASMDEPLPADAAAAPAAAASAPAAAAAAPAAQKPAPPAVEPENGGWVPASPLARRLARELGVDLSSVRGSGPRGRVVEKDIRAAAEASAAGKETAAAGADPKRGEAVPLTPLRRIIAERLGRSKREVPHYYVRKTCDVSRLVEYRAALKPRLPGVTVTDVLIRAVAETLVEFPDLNALFENDRLVRCEAVNIGLAVSREQGLVVPVLRNVQERTVAGITPERARLVARAREDRLSRDEVSGGTFTISNLGVYGIDSFFPIIYQPQVAIMGVGAIRDGVTAAGRTITVRPLMEVTLACDHRVVDGDASAGFLARLQEVIAGLGR